MGNPLKSNQPWVVYSSSACLTTSGFPPSPVKSPETDHLLNLFIRSASVLSPSNMRTPRATCRSLPSTFSRTTLPASPSYVPRVCRNPSRKWCASNGCLGRGMLKVQPQSPASSVERAELALTTAHFVDHELGELLHLVLVGFRIQGVKQLVAAESCGEVVKFRARGPARAEAGDCVEVGKVADEEEGLFAGVFYESEVDLERLLQGGDMRSSRSEQGVGTGYDAEAKSEGVGGEGGGEEQVGGCVEGHAVWGVRVWLMGGRLDASCGYG